MKQSPSGEIIRFELPTLEAAESLGDLLAEGWGAWVLDGRDPPRVIATLNTDPTDLAILLRVVENWVENESLWAITYELDGRGYVLAAGEPHLAESSAA